MNEKTKEFRQKISESFIKSLEENQLEWKKGWKVQSMLPVNATNNRMYNGINRFWLCLVAMDKGTDDPRWCTFKQIQDKGWKLNKGSKGAKVEYWMPYDKKEKKGITWEDYRKRNGEPSVTLVSRYYVVFNGKDIEGIPSLAPLEINNINPDEIISKL
jgi:antirestriction protein ArdC